MKEVTNYEYNSVPLPSNTFSAPTGKSFGGWNTKADGSGTGYDDGDTVYLSRNITLYAQWVDPVASVKTTAGKTSEYATVAAAVKAANEANGSTITLKKNSTTSALSITGNNIILDLNGCTLETKSTDYSSFTSLLTVDSSASLTIKDSGTNGSIYYNIKQLYSFTDCQAIYNYGSLTIEGGTIKNTGGTSSSYAIATSGELTVTGGTISSDSAYAIYDNSSYGSTITVDGGTITSKAKDAVSLSKGSITVTKGEISSTATDGSAIKGGTAIVSGGTISSTNSYAIANSNITLSGNPQITGKYADICLKGKPLDWENNNKIADELTIPDTTPLKITDGQDTPRDYGSITVFTADGYTIEESDVQKLKFVDSKGNDYKYTYSSSTYTYTFQLDSSKNAITLKQTTS